MSPQPIAQGLIVAVVTPYNDELEPDLEALKWLVERHAEAGTDGLFVAGTTGEWLLLRPEEKLRIFEAAVEASQGKVKIFAGVSAATPLEAIALARMVRDTGVDGVFATPPLYYRAAPSKLKEHYAGIVEAAEKPLILYTIPSHVGYNIPVETVRDLAFEHSLVAGIKATVDDLHYIHSLVAEVKSLRPDFAVLAGYGEYMLDTLAAGGDGAVDAVSNLTPRLAKRIYEKWTRGKYGEAVKLHQRQLRLALQLRQYTPLQATLKALLATLKAPVKPHTRPPLNVLPETSLEPLKNLLCTTYKEYLLPGLSCD